MISADPEAYLAKIRHRTAAPRRPSKVELHHTNGTISTSLHSVKPQRLLPFENPLPVTPNTRANSNLSHRTRTTAGLELHGRVATA
jgi:hypothetical protein